MSTRIQEGIGHGLLSLPPFKTLWNENCQFHVQIPTKNAIIAKERYVCTADAPQECISAAIAWQITSMMSISHNKDAC